MYVCLCVCLSVCLRGYLRNHLRNLYHFLMRVAYDCGSVLLREGDEIRRGRGSFGGFLPYWQCIVQHSIWDPYKNGNRSRCRWLLRGVTIPEGKVRSFVRSLLRAGVQPTLDPSAETFYVGPMRHPRERRGIGRCVRCMCKLCRVEEGLSREGKVQFWVKSICPTSSIPVIIANWTGPCSGTRQGQMLDCKRWTSLLSAVKWTVRLHTAGKVWYLRLPCLTCIWIKLVQIMEDLRPQHSCIILKLRQQIDCISKMVAECFQALQIRW